MTVETEIKPKAQTALMAGKRGLVMGVANDHSIAYGIARTLQAHGAELALTVQNDAFARRVRPLADALGSRLVLRCDVEDGPSLDQAFATLAETWGGLDFLVHAIAYSDKEEFKGRYLDTSRENFVRTLLVSCYSFTEVVRRASGLMPAGGAMLTLTFAGAERVMPHYNMMGIAKAALEASVRYLAADLGPNGIRVNAISAGPMRTLAGSAVGSGRALYRFARRHSPLQRNVTLDDMGQAALYLLSDLSAAVTGDIHYVDAGYHVVGMPGALVEGNGNSNGNTDGQG